jgi:hypothetical protein
MDNTAAYALIQSNTRMIEAMGMHWANKSAMIEKTGPLPYNEGDFSNLAHEHY